jgi:hypothetical protein
VNDQKIAETIALLKYVFELEKVECELSEIHRHQMLEHSIDILGLLKGDPSVIAAEMKMQGAAFLLPHFKLFDVVRTERVERWM